MNTKFALYRSVCDHMLLHGNVNNAPRPHDNFIRACYDVDLAPRDTVALFLRLVELEEIDDGE